MGQAHVNEGYELYQIISDFGNPLEIFREALQNSFDENATKIYLKVYEETYLGGNKLIIDILDNGNGLSKNKVAVFYDTANSTKIDDHFLPTGKHGYKGHGSKVFFNAEQVTICSKTKEGEHWISDLKEPLKQIAETGKLEYDDPYQPDTSKSEVKEIMIPDDWESGFRVRIISPKLFASHSTRSCLNHIYIRDYCKWYSIFGTVETEFNSSLRDKDISLYLAGLNLSNFMSNYKSELDCDPVPEYAVEFGTDYEKIQLGHIFPKDRTTKTVLKAYADDIKSDKYWYDYYSRIVFKDEVVKGGLRFRLIICIEGYEAKRRHDLLLTRRGVASTDMSHTDAARYGLWACKGGVPVEKVDDWIEGGRGVGTYTYMQAFVDCDEFELTANRGSIRNTDIEKLNLIKQGVNEVFKSTAVANAIAEREEIESREKTNNSIEEDRKALEARYKKRKSRKIITFKDGQTFLEPTKIGRNAYSESETFALLITLIQKYPDLFPFKLIDYNTTKGIDFVVDVSSSPKYIELKGLLTKSINHPFSLIYKFIAYDIDVSAGEEVVDLDEKRTTLKVNKSDVFVSTNKDFDGKTYTSYVLVPELASIQSMEIINLKSLLTEVLEATIT